MTNKNNINENLQSNNEDNVQRNTETVFPKTSFPEIEFIFDEKSNKIGEIWIMN